MNLWNSECSVLLTHLLFFFWSSISFARFLKQKQIHTIIPHSLNLRLALKRLGWAGDTIRVSTQNSFHVDSPPLHFVLVPSWPPRFLQTDYLTTEIGTPHIYGRSFNQLKPQFLLLRTEINNLMAKVRVDGPWTSYSSLLPLQVCICKPCTTKHCYEGYCVSARKLLAVNTVYTQSTENVAL